MTSSLVGSEMCIRDRPRPFPATSAHELLARPERALHALHRGREAWFGPCLLYTSDAADDM
eukprot:3983660-Prorocentrum_lima.AAC.1